ncbi:ABC transporter substrate-binding protein [Sphingobacterium sp. SRCM116780]|uniref:ABC transporter substrate-binding protein n=1 Tax=Sphingobacterium sp. SRCM116780 TaxID=2907623 RepID=UPI001F192270|nr:ABC transporter substrate-binding protein [Sphingobacterium sp. SRCM116780]UIR57237.1 ABC transporter substrate-binding protein [Sphingobacterium sp. SRCM116780]
MTSVLNHQQRLSGNKVVLAVALALSLASCTTQKKGVLRSPSYTKGEQGTVSTGAPSATQKAEETKKLDAAKASENLKKQKTIALLLPFQLNHISGYRPTSEDVKRSALALDFYQGFQLGIEELGAKGSKFNLQVVDSEDDNFRNASLATSSIIKNANLIVGPVYPKEIKAFAQSFKDKNILQISPLAASLASDFSIPNLVSLTPSIRTHSEVMAKYVSKQYGYGDVVLVYNIQDADSKQFLDNFTSEVLGYNKNVQIKVVTTIAELNENLVVAGTNHLVCGTTNKNQIRALLANMDVQSSESGYAFKLYGHPNWAKLSFDEYTNMDSYELTVTTSSLVDEYAEKTRRFDNNYKAKFTVSPSDFSYKGYDAAIYFGNLLSKYGSDIAQYLVKETYTGINNEFSFDYFPNWGYINRGVRFMVYHNNRFDSK